MYKLWHGVVYIRGFWCKNDMTRLTPLAGPRHTTGLDYPGEQGRKITHPTWGGSGEKNDRTPFAGPQTHYWIGLPSLLVSDLTLLTDNHISSTQWPIATTRVPPHQQQGGCAHQLVQAAETPNPFSRDNTGYFGLPSLPTPFLGWAAAGIQSGGSGSLFGGGWNSSKKKMSGVFAQINLSAPHCEPAPPNPPAVIFTSLSAAWGLLHTSCGPRPARPRAWTKRTRPGALWR